MCFFGVIQTGKTPSPATDTVTVSAAGVGSDAFTDQVAVVANQGILPAAAGFGDVQIDAGILFTQNSGFSTYDLKTSNRTVVGPGQL